MVKLVLLLPSSMVSTWTVDHCMHCISTSVLINCATVGHNSSNSKISQRLVFLGLIWFLNKLQNHGKVKTRVHLISFTHYTPSHYPDRRRAVHSTNAKDIFSTRFTRTDSLKYNNKDAKSFINVNKTFALSSAIPICYSELPWYRKFLLRKRDFQVLQTPLKVQYIMPSLEACKLPRPVILFGRVKC